MRILFWAESFYPEHGGAAIASSNLLLGLREQGHELAVLTQSRRNHEEFQDEYHGVPVHGLLLKVRPGATSLERLLAAKQRVAELKAAFAPDLVHISSGTIGMYAHMETRRDCPAPELMTLHRFWEPRFLRETSTLGRVLRTADRVVCVSRTLRQHVCALIPDIAPRCHVIPNCIETPEGQPAPLPWQPPHIVCIARMAAEKRLHLALDMMPALRKRYPRLRMTLAGQGPERRAIERQRTRLGLEDAVDFPGWLPREAIPALLRRASVVLLPSATEALPLAALEAAAEGRPVVASRVGGVPEVVLDGKTGLLAPPDDTRALQEALLRLLENHALAERMGRAAREHVRRTFAMQHCLRRYEEVYSACLRKEVLDVDAG